MVLFVAGFVGLIYLGLTTQPISTVVLLPNADGGVGMLDVRTDNARLALSSQFASARVRSSGRIVAATEDALQTRQRYAQTLVALPMAPATYVLTFESGSAVDIAPTFKPVLEQLQRVLATFPAAEITVIGHTDSVGSLADNDRLSIERAETVRQLLIETGIAPSMITIAGRGEREPAVPTADEVPLPQNRRVEINLR